MMCNCWNDCLKNKSLSGTIVVLVMVFFSWCMALPVFGQVAPDIDGMLDSYNVIWNTPGPTSAESMPIGNGDIGLNVWVEANGDLHFYLSKTDSWNEDVYGNWGLLKLGGVTVTLTPRPEVTPFTQILKLRTGEMEIKQGNTTYLVWVDANNPVIRVELTSEQPVSMSVSLNNWRTARKNGVGVDVVMTTLTNAISWYHRNSAVANANIANLTFGAKIKGANLVTSNSTTLVSATPATSQMVSIYPLTTKITKVSEWVNQINNLEAQVDSQDLETTRVAHKAWWNQFWHRSWIFVRGDATATKTTQGYVLQRFITACGGRGKYPIKFNGSIFVVDDPTQSPAVTADYRMWGGQYWFQNTRAMYWPRLAAGDFDIMMPLFDMYTNILPANSAKVKEYYGHEGAYFAETAPFWGGLNYAGPEVKEDWTLHYFLPVLELSMMMLDYYEYTGDADFVRQKLLPVAQAGITFYDKHFPRDESGKMLLDSINSIEMYWKVHNPAPDIAGLRSVLSRLITLPDDLVDASTRTAWSELYQQIPELPVGSEDGNTILLPYAGPQTEVLKNNENPGLYAVYPFRLYGLGKPDLQLAMNTFNARKSTFMGCWTQDPIQAAMLGLSTVAKNYVTYNLSRKNPRLKFPAFWDAANDYSPDQDNGGNGENGLQLMIMQAVGKKILLMPAWPNGWEGDFKLNAPFQTTVQGTISNGNIINLVVTPAERAADVVVFSSVKIDRTGWSVTASTNNASASKAIDGVAGSRWDSGGSQIPGLFFTVKFAKKERINKMVLDYAASTDDGPMSYEIYLSDNGTNWYGPVTSGKGGGAATEIFFPTTTVQYVRIKQTGRKGNYWSIHEVNAYGPSSAISVSAVSINPANTTINVNQTLQLTATIVPENSDNQNIVWISSAPAVATVDSNGLVTSHAEGTAKITAVTLDGIIKSDIDITVSLSADIQQEAGDVFGFSVSPNPVKSDLKFGFCLPEASEVFIDLFDMRGNNLKSVKLNGNAGFQQSGFDVSGLPSGIYLIRLATAENSVTRQLIIR